MGKIMKLRELSKNFNCLEPRRIDDLLFHGWPMQQCCPTPKNNHKIFEDDKEVAEVQQKQIKTEN